MEIIGKTKDGHDIIKATPEQLAIFRANKAKLAALQNEGYDEPEPRDNTPEHKEDY